MTTSRSGTPQTTTMRTTTLSITPATPQLLLLKPVEKTKESAAPRKVPVVCVLHVYSAKGHYDNFASAWMHAYMYPFVYPLVSTPETLVLKSAILADVMDLTSFCAF